jgi:class 3 adenylate cyclase
MAMTGLPTGTVTFLFTDIEGSTARWERDAEAMRVALARHDSILKDSIRQHDGVVSSEMGDGVGAVFPLRFRP